MKRSYKKRDARLMLASSYLDNWWQSRENYALEVKKLEELKRDISSVKPIDYSSEIKTSTKSDLSSTMILLEEQEARVKAAYDEYVKTDKEMSKLVSNVSAGSFRIILKAVYDNNMSLVDVAYRYHYTYRNIQQQHNKALLEIYRFITKK